MLIALYYSYYGCDITLFRTFVNIQQRYNLYDSVVTFQYGILRVFLS